MKALLVGFGRFWLDFIVGDDWKIAASVATVLGAAGAVHAADAVGDGLLVGLAAAGLASAFAIAVLADVRSR